MRGGHRVVAFDLDKATVDALAREGAEPAYTMKDVAAKLKSPRVLWAMVPAGAVTEKVVGELAGIAGKGDVVVDGGNSNFKDDVRRAKALAERGIGYADVGTSGGVWGLDRGYCLMVGAEKATFDLLAPLLKTLAPGMGDVPRTQGRKPGGTAEDGYLHCGPVGAGHFVKMIHNGIEYGLMQAYAEGFDILRGATSASLPPEHRFDLPLAEIAEVWRRGSVVGSWLLDLTAAAFVKSPTLSEFEGVVADSGEGRWTVEAAIAEAVPAEVITSALFARFRSRVDHTFGEKVLSAMRAGFGGHQEPGKKKPR